MKMKRNDILRLVVSLSIPLVIGYIGSFFTTPNIEPWYDLLNRPALTPPGSFIGLVWTILYVMIGISLYLIWSKDIKASHRKAWKITMMFFVLQLFLNLMWSMMFFGLRSPWFGILVILPLIVLILFNVYYAYKIDKRAAYLLVPYLLWVSFATYLNIGIAVLN